MAANAASNPLLPAFVPARSIACSIESVVNTALMIGILDSNDTVAIPFS